MPGLQVSNIFIADEKLRLQFKNTIRKTGYSHLNALGLVACTAAYQHGGPMAGSVKKIYLWENIRFVKRISWKVTFPRLNWWNLRVPYLLWLDFSALRLKDDELEKLIEKGKAVAEPRQGFFGVGGEGFKGLTLPVLVRYWNGHYYN